MNTSIYIGALFLVVGWIGIIIIALSYQFKNDEQNKQDPSSMPKHNSDNSLKTGTPE